MRAPLALPYHRKGEAVPERSFHRSSHLDTLREIGKGLVIDLVGRTLGVRILSGYSIDCVGRLLARATNCSYTLILNEASTAPRALVLANGFCVGYLIGCELPLS